MVTIKMVAERCGLSIAAVSRALNNRSGISAERAEYVRQVAREMGYQPNEAARLLKTKCSNNIGILYHNLLTHEFFSEVLEGIQLEAAENGYEITFLQNSGGLTYFEHCQRRQCAGVILVQGPFNHDSVQPMKDSGMPLVFIEDMHPGYTVVRNDNVQAMEDMVRYLHGMGHRRIALICGDPCQVTDQRIEGFRRGCQACGIEIPQGYLQAANYRGVESSAEAVKRLLALPERPTCIIFPDDICFLGGRDELTHHGLRVPEDVSCAGFGGIRVVKLMRPRLTTYDQDASGIGRTAAREIIKAIENPKRYKPHAALVEGHIEPGDTVRPL
ncbi:MAG: LacI family DNA-binding transcriptional regulator [Clostridia bacterium]|nr:LacI family DNA-binding transcriptional regulator [Clostridia bacterium]